MTTHTAFKAPPWHGRLADVLRTVRESPGAARACRDAWHQPPGAALESMQLIGRVLDDEEDSELSVPGYQRRHVETAVATVLSLYAFHQQSVEAPMHRLGPTLGRAARVVHDEMSTRYGLRRYYGATAEADSFPEVREHLRRLVSYLRNHHVALDYVDLADALAVWHRPERRMRIAARWNSDFERPRKRSDSDQPDSAPRTTTGEKE